MFTFMILQLDTIFWSIYALFKELYARRTITLEVNRNNHPGKPNVVMEEFFAMTCFKDINFHLKEFPFVYSIGHIDEI